MPQHLFSQYHFSKFGFIPDLRIRYNCSYLYMYNLKLHYNINNLANPLKLQYINAVSTNQHFPRPIMSKLSSSYYNRCKLSIPPLCFFSVLRYSY